MIDGGVPELPAGVTARVTERYPSGGEREVAYLLGDEVVAVRLYYEDGQVEMHSSRQAGVLHGPEYLWDSSGRLRFRTGYEQGLEHGIAVQWDPEGNEIGTYELRHGTGLDLWRAHRSDGSVYLAEVRFLVSGERHGFEWIVAEDQTSLYRESRYAAGVEHGIFREWKSNGDLTEGFPVCYLLGRAVPVEEYEAATAIDPALPLYQTNDDRSSRTFPPLIRKHLTP